jgi:hypothetical protein
MIENVLEKFNKVRIYINVPYALKEEAKKLKARWDSDKKLWFFDYEADDNFEYANGKIKLLSKFEINSIVHKWYENDDPKFKNIVEYFNNEAKLAKKRLKIEELIENLSKKDYVRIIYGNNNYECIILKNATSTIYTQCIKKNNENYDELEDFDKREIENVEYIGNNTKKMIS